MLREVNIAQDIRDCCSGSEDSLGLQNRDASAVGPGTPASIPVMCTGGGSPSSAGFARGGVQQAALFACLSSEPTRQLQFVSNPTSTRSLEIERWDSCRYLRCRLLGTDGNVGDAVDREKRVCYGLFV